MRQVYAWNPHTGDVTIADVLSADESGPTVRLGDVNRSDGEWDEPIETLTPAAQFELLLSEFRDAASDGDEPDETTLDLLGEVLKHFFTHHEPDADLWERFKDAMSGGYDVLALERAVVADFLSQSDGYRGGPVMIQ